MGRFRSRLSRRRVWVELEGEAVAGVDCDAVRLSGHRDPPFPSTVTETVRGLPWSWLLDSWIAGDP
jgi:hypothetical protein